MFELIHYCNETLYVCFEKRNGRFEISCFYSRGGQAEIPWEIKMKWSIENKADHGDWKGVVDLMRENMDEGVLIKSVETYL